MSIFFDSHFLDRRIFSWFSKIFQIFQNFNSLALTLRLVKFNQRDYEIRTTTKVIDNGSCTRHNPKNLIPLWRAISNVVVSRPISIPMTHFHALPFPDTKLKIRKAQKPQNSYIFQKKRSKNPKIRRKSRIFLARISLLTQPINTHKKKPKKSSKLEFRNSKKIKFQN